MTPSSLNAARVKIYAAEIRVSPFSNFRASVGQFVIFGEDAAGQQQSRG
jgi:hypothetical protein